MLGVQRLFIGTLLDWNLWLYCILCMYSYSPSLPQWLSSKDPPAMLEIQEMWVPSLGWEDSWRRARQPTPVFLPREFHGQWNLAGYSPYRCKELDTTEVTENTCIHSYSPNNLWDFSPINISKVPCSRVLTCRFQLSVRDFALIWVLTKGVTLQFKTPKFRIHSVYTTMCYMGKYSSATL